MPRKAPNGMAKQNVAVKYLMFLRFLRSTLISVLTYIVFFVGFATSGEAQSRIKDIVDFEGVRENLLVGYGLVVGLNGTGDSLGSSVFNKEILIGMLERLGINELDTILDTKNVAAVMVTANYRLSHAKAQILTPFPR